MTRRRYLWPAIGLVVAALGAAAVFAVPRLPERGNTVPTALVTKGPLKVTVHATGELRAGRTMTLVTPPVGGMLRIVQIRAIRCMRSSRRSPWSPKPNRKSSR